MEGESLTLKNFVFNSYIFWVFSALEINKPVLAHKKLLRVNITLYRKRKFIYCFIRYNNSSCYRTLPSAIWQIFRDFLINCNLHNEPSDQWNDNQIWERKEIFVNIALGNAITTLSLNSYWNQIWQEFSYWLQELA